MNHYTDYTFFYKKSNPLSNLHPCKFKDEEGNEYNCSEQWIMSEKAKLFGDEEIRKEIISSKDPDEQKELGRKVKNFDSVIWNKNAKRIAYEGCLLKFTQNHKLLKFLIATEGTLLVKADANDKIWGIGLHEDDPSIYDQLNWDGLNWSGEVLTQLRDDLLNDA